MGGADDYKNNNTHHTVSSDIVLQLMQASFGHHYLVIYPNIETLRRTCTDYIKLQLEEVNVAVLFLPYFDTTDKVRYDLIMKGVDVSRHGRNGSLVLLDFDKIIDNPYLGVPAAFGLKEFMKSKSHYR